MPQNASDSNLPVGSSPRPPVTRQDNVRETLHGVEVLDPYRWLEDQESPETRAWIEAQNAYTHALLDALPERAAIQQRLTELLKIDAVSTPVACSGTYFFTKRLADQELPVIYRRKGLTGADEPLIDPNTLTEDKSLNVNIADVSRDGALLAYMIRRGGEDEVEVHLRDVEAGTDLPDVLPKARYFGLTLTPDKSGFYYTRHDDNGPRIYFHTLGSDPSRDKELFGAGYGADKLAFAQLSEDGRWLLITVYYGSAAKQTELYFQNVAEQGPILPIVNDIEARFSGSIGGDTLYMQTNWEAPNGRLLTVDLRDPSRDHWQEILPTSEAVLEHFSLAGGKLFVNFLENVTSHLRMFAPDGALLREISLPALGSVSGVSGWWDSDEAFFAFSSFPIPATIYRYDIPSDTREIWARQEAPVDSARFEVKQVWYASKDGMKVPMFLVHRKGLTLDGARPTLLTGYGGFNASLTPNFSNIAVLWAEHDGVFALANLRGGGEFGEAWHQAGMLENKQNVFDDFIAAAEWLVANDYTQSAKLAIAGGSNGGLLVGAALTQRPDLFRAVLCTVPLLDMVRYHQFLVARFWVPEYGSSEDPKQFRTLLAYSPYHHVKPGTSYPAVMFVTGDADTRVAPLHARKMAARLQAAGSDRPILLHYDTKAGHSGGKPINKLINELADEQAFLFWQLGADDK